MNEPIDIDALQQQAKVLKLHGLLAHWDETDATDLPLIDKLLQWERRERQQRGLERRLALARLGHFKALADFDWDWPQQCDKGAISDLLKLDFIKDATNIILMGPNGVGKSTIARNIAWQAVMQGHTALFVEAAQMLGDLAVAPPISPPDFAALVYDLEETPLVSSDLVLGITAFRQVNRMQA
ncbi:MAG: ATP-binding protein [Proteobacteria bacterium]|nr:ATP-binding protein [Pseudomonadota bacterium]